jgi:hypothetical protein
MREMKPANRNLTMRYARALGAAEAALSGIKGVALGADPVILRLVERAEADIKRILQGEGDGPGIDR